MGGAGAPTATIGTSAGPRTQVTFNLSESRCVAVKRLSWWNGARNYAHERPSKRQKNRHCCDRDGDDLCWVGLRIGRTLIPSEVEIATEYLAELDLSQPWNSEKNMRFAKGLPEWSRDVFHRYPHQRTDGRSYLMALLGAIGFGTGESGPRKGKLKQYPNSVLMLSLPTTDVDFMEPLDITEAELLARVQEGQRVLFITAAGRGYGIVGINEGRLTWELSL